MTLIYIGACFKTLVEHPLAESLRFCNYDELNSLKVSHDEFPLLLDSIKNLNFVEEVSLISTCNRFELYCFLSTKKASNENIHAIIEAIREINKSNVELSVLQGVDAELHFLRTYCGLNSTLIGENEISQQINISFGQSIAMGYLKQAGSQLLHKAVELRKVLDKEVYKEKNSYCNVVIQKSLQELNVNTGAAITVLGSGSTAYQAVSSLINLGISAESITVVHRISSSSSQVSAFKNNLSFTGLHFIRAKYGYHSPRVKDLVFNSDLAIFAIDSKEPVIHFPKSFKVNIIDFNSRQSVSFDEVDDSEKYISGKKLDAFVRDYSSQLLTNNDFAQEINKASDILSASLTSFVIAS